MMKPTNIKNKMAQQFNSNCIDESFIYAAQMRTQLYYKLTSRQGIRNFKMTTLNQTRNIKKYLLNEKIVTKEELSYWLGLFEILDSSQDEFPTDRIYTLRQLMPPDVWCEAVGDCVNKFGYLVKDLSSSGFISLEFIAKNSANHCLYRIIRG